MSTVSLKVTVSDQGITKTMQFAGDMTINDVCKEIRAKIGETVNVSTDHGLFYPIISKWLLANKTLDYYDLKTGDTIEYKKKHRALRVRLMDDTIKTVLIDESHNVADLVVNVCQKIGISNPEEYSLQTEKALNDSRDNLAEEKRWLGPEKTLAEQGVVETDILLLKKKFFFSDQNVDRNDPIQLNLLYVQSRDAIVSGKHPCTLDEAAQLAALQCQVQYGNHEPDKHKPGFIKIKEFVPPEYHKDKKELEKKIYQEHRKLQGLTELNAKFRYVQLCRSLKTYGVTFFLVKENVPKKNKMVPRLLGVTRDSIMRLDAETKEILKTWPLTTLRRWAAAPNSFTLDFGDYADSYYSVQTSEGEPISQLIGGYIDIILKKRKEASRKVEEEEVQVAIAEDNVRPAKATAVNLSSHKVGRAVEVNVASAGVVSDDSGKIGSRQVIKRKNLAQATEVDTVQYSAYGSQQAVMQNINNGFAAINAATNELTVATQLPPIGNDPASKQWKVQTMDVNKQLIGAQVAAHLASTASVVTIGSVNDSDFIDFEQLASNIASLSSNLNQITSSTKMVAALMDQMQGDKVLEAARAFAAATSSLLQGIQPLITGEEFHNNNPYKAGLLQQGQEISKAAFQLLFKIGEIEIPQQQQQELIDLAKLVTQATAGLVANGVKPLAIEIQPNPHLRETQQFILGSARDVATAAEALVTVSVITAPAIHLGVCQDQVMQGTVSLSDALNAMNASVDTVKQEIGGDSKGVNEMAKHVQKVINALARFIEKVKDPMKSVDEAAESKASVFDAVLNASSELIYQRDNVQQIVANAKELTLAGTQLVNYLKKRSDEESDPDEKQKLIAQAKAVAENIHKIVALAKELAKNPKDEAKQSKLKEAIDAIQALTLQAAGKEARDRLFKKLVAQAKQLASATTSLIAATKGAAQSNRDQVSQIQVTQAAKKAADSTVNMVVASKSLLTNVEDPSNQLKLVSVSRSALSPTTDLVAAVKTASSTTVDSSAQESLMEGVYQVEEAMKALITVLDQAENASSGLEYESAFEIVKQVNADLQQAKEMAAAGKLRIMAGYTAESAQLEVSGSSKMVGSAISQLVAASSQGNEKLTGVAARDTANALLAWTTAVRALAGSSQDDKKFQEQLIASAQNLSKHVSDLLNGAKAVVKLQKTEASGTKNVESAQSSLANSAKETNDLIFAVVDTLPGNRDIERALQVVMAGIEILETGPKVKPVAGESIQMSQNRLNVAASGLAAAVNSVIAASSNGNPDELKNSAAQFEDKYNKLVTAAQGLIAQTNDEKAKAEIMAYVKSVAEASSGLLQSSKSARSDASGSNGLSSLTSAAKNMAGCISKLLEVCSTSAPGVSSSNQAEQKLLLAGQKLTTYNDPSIVSNLSYFDCIKQTVDVQKVVLQSTAAVASAGKENDGEKLGKTLLDISDAIEKLAETCAKAAYLIGVSDRSSIPGQPALIDQQAVVDSSNEIKSALTKMNDSKSNQQTVLQAASAVAKHTALLCNIGKQASTNAGISANGKQQFQLAAKNIATTTAALAQDIKALATAPSATTRENANKSSAPLIEAVDVLVALANSPEYGATPPTLSPMAQAKQKPVIDTSKNVISLTQDLVSTGKAICSSGAVDASQVHLLTTQSKAVSDSLKFLTTTVKQSAPGQQDIQAAIEKVSGVAAQLESASLHVEVDEGSASGGNAVTGSNMNLAAASATGLDQTLKDKLLDNAKALASLIHMIADSAKGKIEQGQSPLEAAGNLSYAVIQLAETFQPMGVTAIGLSQSTSSKPFQKTVLEGVKRIADDTLTFLYAAKDAGGDAKNAESHAKIDNTMNLLTASLNKMALKLEGSTKGSAEISKVSSNIQDTLRSISENRPSSAANDSYQQYATQLFSNGKNLVDIVGDVITKSVKPDKDVLLPVIEHIGNVYKLIVKNAVNGSSCVTDPKVKQSLLDVSRELGGSTLKLVDAVKSALISASSGDGVVDPNSKQKLTNASKEVTQNVSKLMAVSKEGSKSLTACENVVELIGDVLADLESHIIFAQAGQLDSNDKEKFDAYQEELQSLARELVDNSKTLVSHGAMGKSDDLAVSATLVGETLMSLKESTKLAAFALTSNDSGTQEELLSQCRDVAKALAHLLNMAIDLGTKPLKPLAGTINATTIPTDFVQFREAAKDLVNQVGDFIKTVKYIGDESSRGARALESSAREIERAVQILEDDSPAEGTALPDEVAQIAKSVAAASANLVSVASKGINNLTQDELVTSTTELKKVLLDLTRAGKASTEQAPEDARTLMHGAIKSVADATCLLLNKVKLIAEGQSSGKSEVQYAAKEVASSVGKVVEAAGELIPGGYVDPNDPNVVAERELLAAASSIEAAARKLAMLKPPERPREANEDLNFEEQILEAAKAIASATSALIKSATSAQREIVAKGKVSNKREDQMYFSDGTWSDGLVSAAKNVASATGDLCEAANAAVKGEIQRERVIVSARNVSSSTIQLLHSAATRTDSNSQSQMRLKAAGKSVTQATEALVKAAEQTMAYEEEDNVSSLMKGKGSNAMQKAQELEAAAKVLQMEKELENARMKLAGMRKAKYKK